MQTRVNFYIIYNFRPFATNDKCGLVRPAPPHARQCRHAAWPIAAWVSSGFFTVCNFSNFGIVDNRHFGFRIVTSVSISVFQTIGYRLSVRFFGIEYRLLLLLLSPRPLLLLQRQQWAQGSACIMSIDWRWCSSLLHRHRTMHRSEQGTGYNHLSDLTWLHESCF